MSWGSRAIYSPRPKTAAAMRHEEPWRLAVISGFAMFYLGISDFSSMPFIVEHFDMDSLPICMCFIM